MKRNALGAQQNRRKRSWMLRHSFVKFQNTKGKAEIPKDLRKGLKKKVIYKELEIIIGFLKSKPEAR